ncbi:MAG: hypothetical protein V1913_00985 [Fibrobacterota bacterium]
MKVLPVLALLAMFSHAEKSVMTLSGTLDSVFLSAGRQAAVCFHEGSTYKTALLSEEMAPLGTHDIPGDIVFLNNRGFVRYLAVAEKGLVDTAAGLSFSKLTFLDFQNGQVLPARQNLRTQSRGKWLPGGEDFSIEGRLYTVRNGQVQMIKVASVPLADVSADKKWCVSAVVEKISGEKMRVNYALENLVNQDMINIESDAVRNDSIPPFAFTSDPRYLYYRAGQSPALYDLEKRRSLLVDNISFKQPDYFGYFFGDEKTYYFFDYLSVVAVDKKSFKVKAVLGNPGASEHIDIYAADAKHVYGALYTVKPEGRDYTKLFHLVVRGETVSFAPLPTGVKALWFNGNAAAFLYLSENELHYNTLKLK